jgi:hypothetical protein
MTTVRIIIGIIGVLSTATMAVAALSAGAKLEAARRPDAPPLPAWNWAKFRYLSDRSNLRPEAAPLVGRYRRLWYASILLPLAWVALIPWLLEW